MSASLQGTSKKHKLFVCEPMGRKKVTELSGIGPVAAAKLQKYGIEMAFEILGYFLVCRKDKEVFMEWLQDKCGCNTRNAATCYDCLHQWSVNFL